MDPTDQVPSWILRPLPAHAAIDQQLHSKIDAFAQKLPDSIGDIHQALSAVQMFREYDAAANRACAYIWLALERFSGSNRRGALFSFARGHMVERALARVCRRLAKDADGGVRRGPRRHIERGEVREVALPLTANGTWDATGWLRGTVDRPLARHARARNYAHRGLPPLTTLGQLRALLGIRSPRQLGYFLLASDQGNGPYTRFTIPKRNGADREICSPKSQLRWVQRSILDEILVKVPAHPAAHGFINGRSTVTNATPHQGAKLLLKFDLADFFPTVHYYRVLGLFASLGYAVGDARFGTADGSRQVAPTLARLCCYTSDPRLWGDARLPQGAPTSPAISNLVCRRLDARLDGLAKKFQGVYTRYADDLTFSFKTELAKVGRFRWWVDQICHQEGFFVHQGKFHLIRAAQRQVVTGIVVNDVLRIPREERRRFRAILHNCRRHGIDSQKGTHPRFVEYLRGFASYVHMVYPDEGDRFIQQVNALLGP